MTKILVKKIVPKLKDGSQISGITSKGRQWYLWWVNDKYNMFGYSEEPPVEEGKEYDFDIKTEQKGKYTNTTISLIKKAFGGSEIVDALKKIYAKIDELDKKFNAFTEIFTEKDNDIKPED